MYRSSQSRPPDGQTHLSQRSASKLPHGREPARVFCSAIGRHQLRDFAASDGEA
jgi:hypothetical protein